MSAKIHCDVCNKEMTDKENYVVVKHGGFSVLGEFVKEGQFKTIKIVLTNAGISQDICKSCLRHILAIEDSV